MRQVILLVRSLEEGRLSLFFPSEYQQKNVKNTVENKVPDNGLEATILRFKFSLKNVKMVIVFVLDVASYISIKNTLDQN